MIILICAYIIMESLCMYTVSCMHYIGHVIHTDHELVIIIILFLLSVALMVMNNFPPKSSSITIATISS